MDLSHLLPPVSFMHPTIPLNKSVPATTVHAVVNQSLPDSTTESPTTTQLDPMLLQVDRSTELQQFMPCVAVSKNDGQTLNSMKTLNDSEVEEFTSLINDVSVSVEVDSTQPSQSLGDLHSYTNHPDLGLYQQFQASQVEQPQQVTQSSISQLIQPELYSNEERVPEHMLGQLDHRITKTVPDFSKYPKDCKCAFIDKLVAVEQIWFWNGQLYFLPQISILIIGNREYAGIFHEQSKGYIAMGEVIEKMMPQYEADLVAFLKRTENIDQVALTPQEIGYLEQRKSIRENCRYNFAVSLSMLRKMAQFIIMYEGDKPGFNNRIKDIANGTFYKKILQRNIRCGTCGGIILQSDQPEDYVLISTDDNNGKEDDLKCFSVGYIIAGSEKFVAFRIDNRVYVSFKDLCQKKVLKLQVLQSRLGALRQRPRLAPDILNNYLNTPEYNVSNTMWIDIATLRCVCCMAKCSPGYNNEVYICFATVSFKEHFITNIYGKDDQQSDNAVFTLDPKTYEVIMKKTRLKSQKPPQNDKPTNRSHKPTLKSFEMSSRENVGYDSPVKLNESAFCVVTNDESKWKDSTVPFREQKPKSARKTPRTPKTPTEDKDQETYVFDDKDSIIDFLNKTYGSDNKSKNKKSKKKKEEAKYIPGKTPTFRVKPAERPYSAESSLKAGEEKKKKDLDNSQFKITKKDDKFIFTITREKNVENESKPSDAVETDGVKKGKKKSKKLKNTEDENQKAVQNLMTQFDQESCHEEVSNMRNGDTISAASLTPRTESRILSQVDLNGSINNMFETPSQLKVSVNNMFETPSQQKVVVEMMDTGESQNFNDSTSPLSRLYQQYEQFEKEGSPGREGSKTPTSGCQTPKLVTEENLQDRNEKDMPIHVEMKETGCENVDHVGNVVNDTVQNDKIFATPIKNSSQKAQNSMSSERPKRAKTLSPPKTRELNQSPIIERLIRTRSLNSPIFEKSGKIDRTFARVQQLSEIEDRSQPLDLLASLAEVITETNREGTQMSSESDEAVEIEQIGHLEIKPEPLKELPQKQIDSDMNCNQIAVTKSSYGLKSQSSEKHVSDPSTQASEHIEITQNSSEISNNSSQLKGSEPDSDEKLFTVDENSNTEILTLNKYKEEETHVGSSDIESVEGLKNLFKELSRKLNIEQYCDDNGNQIVELNLNPEIKSQYPGIFGDDVDLKKLRLLVSMLGCLHLSDNSNSILSPTSNSDELDTFNSPLSTTSSGNDKRMILKKHKSQRSEKISKKTPKQSKSPAKSNHKKSKNELRLDDAKKICDNAIAITGNLHHTVDERGDNGPIVEKSITSPSHRSRKRSRNSLEHQTSKRQKSC